VRSIRDGIPPLEAARLIRSVVGLDPRRAQAVANYRAELVEQGAANVSALVDRYAARQLRQRADVIARTEILEALNDGALESWRQAREDGFLGGNAAKEWIVTRDEKLDDECAALDGEVVPLDAQFSAGVDGPPLHPQCRCAVAPVV
jgi:SPP1 gp7 family putative phage head morphogenesis protein